MIQLAGRPFNTTMLCTDTPNATAIPPQVSPVRTLYSTGGNGVSEGIKVGTGVSVGVDVMVAVAVGLPATVGVISCDPPRPALRPKYTTAAPMIRISRRAPTAAGRLSVISGMRLACMPVSTLFDFRAAFAVNSVPHTRQRVAFSLNRVPQVGQTFVFCCEEGS